MGKKRKDIHPNHALSNIGIYFKWRVQRAKEFFNLSKSYFSVKGKKVLDIGCGIGPLTYVLAKNGASVSAMEVESKTIKIAKNFTKGLKVKFKVGVNEKLPFSDKEFDSIYSFDVIEHVQNYPKSILEMKRCLKLNGFIFIEMTPYYSLISGHHLYNFSLLPAQFLPKSLMKRIIMSKKPFAVRSPQQAWDTFITLNHITIRGLKKSLNKNGLEMIEESYIFKIPKLFSIKINWIRHLGFLQEIIPMSYQVALRKVGN